MRKSLLNFTAVAVIVLPLIACSRLQHDQTTASKNTASADPGTSAGDGANDGSNNAGTTPAPTPTPVPPLICPPNFVKVAATADVKEFCLAKFEMKQTADGSIVTQPALAPMIADRATAAASCAKLGAHYRLPTNAEWNTTALEIASLDTNWTGGKVKSGSLYVGVYSKWSAPLSITSLSDPYNQVFKNPIVGICKHAERRELNLKNDQTIWDFAGNAWEWVSDEIDGDSFTPRLTVQQVGYTDSYFFPKNSDQSKMFIPMSSISSNYHVGAFFGGTKKLVIRGGATGMMSAQAAGMFAANIGDITSNERRAPSSWGLAYDNVGFRCAYQ